MVVLDSIIITRPFWATHYPGVLQVENHVAIGVILKQGFFPWSFVLLKRLNLAPCVWRSIVGESFRNTPIYFSHTLQILLQVWIYIPHFLCRVNKNKPSSIDQADRPWYVVKDWFSESVKPNRSKYVHILLCYVLARKLANWLLQVSNISPSRVLCCSIYRAWVKFR